ncbi:MAG: transglutaminase family protein [Rhodocyclaceae bacterium]|nr:transglutaminase family protein [Rhodocyclaceae bacterium]MCA3027559.1 transglutaminase family protein [Rhodocyclaceae bacterium]MCA3039066.1 transglutaminase family protein [Rhodocyclaceae bacterium]MCA3064193.1 transglutaminase family protein [Rhodocyclaceae bacterium]
MSLKVAKVFYAVTLLVWSGAVFSLEANHRMMKGLSTQFAQPLVTPTKYFSFVREMSRVDSEIATLKESWEVELPANSDDSNALFLPPVIAGMTDYVGISIAISTTAGRWENAPVDYKAYDLTDAKGVRVTVKAAYIKIPKTRSPARLKVSFSIQGSIAGGLEEHGLTLALPIDTPVKEARLVLRRGLIGQDNLEAELNGFTERQISGTSGRDKEYGLSKEWFGSKVGGGERPPEITISYGQWSSIAAKHAQFYRAELASSDIKDVFKIAPIVQDILNSTNYSKIEKAYHLSKWIGQFLRYDERGFTFNLKEKYTPNTIRQTLDARTGNCLDFVMLYLKLLSAAGIYAEPVEVNGSGWGPAQLKSVLPQELAFNHVIVYIPELGIYVDPTLTKLLENSSFTLFGIGTAVHSNVYGLNLFSGKLIQINPGQIQSKVSIHTTYAMIEGQWIGKTRWEGSGDAYRAMTLAEHRRNLRKQRGEKLDRVFTNSGTVLLHDSWKFEADDVRGSATLDFSFVLGPELVDAKGRPRFLPNNVMSLIVLRYEYLDYATNPEACFGSESSEEIIELNGQAGFSIPPELQDAKLNGVSSSFSQKISINDTGLKLHRKFFLNEKRPVCSAAEIEAQKSLYARIKELKSKTHVATSLQNAK